MEDFTIFKWTAAAGPPKAFKRFSGHLNFPPPRLASLPSPQLPPPPTCILHGQSATNLLDNNYLGRRSHKCHQIRFVFRILNTSELN